MSENRRHFRLREFIDVVWNVTDLDISGEGVVINISKSGLLLQTDRVFRPAESSVVSIGSGIEVLPFAPKQGRIMWLRRIRTPEERLQCGVQFLPSVTDDDFQQWLQSKVDQLSDAGDAKILGNLAY